MSLPLSTVALPLFPLHTVLMPGGMLALRVFEPRYLDLVQRCLRTGEGFGVCLIEEGGEAGTPARPAGVGTEARIVDAVRREDGLLGIAVEGERRFRICTRATQSDGLQVAEVLWLPAPPPRRPRPGHALLLDLLRRLLERAGGPHAHAEPGCFDDADWTSLRLAELLPLALDQRQHLLEEADPRARLDALLRWLPTMA